MHPATDTVTTQRLQESLRGPDNTQGVPLLLHTWCTILPSIYQLKPESSQDSMPHKSTTTDGTNAVPVLCRQSLPDTLNCAGHSVMATPHLLLPHQPNLDA